MTARGRVDAAGATVEPVAVSNRHCRRDGGATVARGRWRREQESASPPPAHRLAACRRQRITLGTDRTVPVSETHRARPGCADGDRRPSHDTTVRRAERSGESISSDGAMSRSWGRRGDDEPIVCPLLQWGDSERSDTTKEVTATGESATMTYGREGHSGGSSTIEDGREKLTQPTRSRCNGATC